MGSLKSVENSADAGELPEVEAAMRSRRWEKKQSRVCFAEPPALATHSRRWEKRQHDICLLQLMHEIVKQITPKRGLFA